MQERGYIRADRGRQPQMASLLDQIEERERAEEKKRVEKKNKPSKKQLILDLYRAGMTEIDRIAAEVHTTSSYAAAVLQAAGLLKGYYDLYTTTSSDQNLYSKFFRNVLSFKNPEAARESVQRLDSLYRYFERIGDRAGQHHAQVIALTGRNRARWSGKLEEAKIFSDWLMNT